MARKGSAKVRTGCRTCKLRKVKCDEAKPACRRCVSTDRVCDGYATDTDTRALIWYRPRQTACLAQDESRTLQYFYERVGPVISGPHDEYFWTHIVMQFSALEPAVKHSLLAIGSLYEQLRPDGRLELADNKFALHNYNHALRELRNTKSEPLVLLGCILCICIEFMLGNRDAAVEHCRHGILILQGTENSVVWAKEHLSPMFRRLSVFPYFFGDAGSTFPKIAGLDDPGASPLSTLADAQFLMDGLVNRVIRLVRAGDTYRIGDLRSTPIAIELLEEQESIKALMKTWYAEFTQLNSEGSLPARAFAFQMIRFEIVSVWADMVFEVEEMKYDKYFSAWQSAVERGNQLLSWETSGQAPVCKTPAPFSFEMGFMPLLYFVVMKCRFLKLRLEALALVKNLTTPRENLWEVSTMYATGRRLIELEHECLLDDSGWPSTPVDWTHLPSEEMRIRDSSSDPETTTTVDESGNKVASRQARFVLRDSQNEVYVQTVTLQED